MTAHNRYDEQRKSEATARAEWFLLEHGRFPTQPELRALREYAVDVSFGRAC